MKIDLSPGDAAGVVWCLEFRAHTLKGSDDEGADDLMRVARSIRQQLGDDGETAGQTAEESVPNS